MIKKLVRDDPDAFDQIFENYYRKVYAFSLGNFRNKEDAEEAVQDVFYNLWKDRAKLKDLKDLEAWIFTICLNIIRKHFRKLASEKRHLQKYAESYSDSDSSTMTEVEYRDLLERTERIIEDLPPRQRTIFLLSRKESLSNLEISKKLNISVRTVDNQLSKAKAFLKEALIDGSLLSLLFFHLFIN
ncbi:MAG: RNA polymerase sigma-70 factor [Bacteroidota bacterium]